MTGVNFSGTSGHEGASYFQIASFDIGSLNIPQLDAHWTMSCGNDAIDGFAELKPTSVPEPSAWLLMSTGLIGLLGGVAARWKRKA